MRKIREVLRLRFGVGLRQDEIAHSCSIGQAHSSSVSLQGSIRGCDLAAAGRLG